MSRPSEYTRNNILKAAVALFAERGYDGTSIRAIVSKARVNQAAINCHFKGKEGLYFEVLKVAFAGYLQLDNFDPERLKAMPREEAMPKLRASAVAPPSRPRSDEPLHPHLRVGERSSQQGADQLCQVRAVPCRFSPARRSSCGASLPAETSDQDAMCAAISLMGQCSVFVRNREQFAQPPFNLKIDEAFVARLTDFVRELALNGHGAPVMKNYAAQKEAAARSRD